MKEFANNKLLAHKQGPLGWITFNTPERRNAVSLDMWRTIPEIVAYFNQDPDVRVLVLRGAGEEAFIAGADISEFETNRNTATAVKHYEETTYAAFQALRESEKPIIAMIRGFCMGGGCAIALSCDLRIAADDCKFSIPPAKLGIAYGYENVKRVVDVVGPAFAREMLYTARVYDATDAMRMGLIQQCVTPDSLQAFTEKYANTIAHNAPLSVRASKVAIDNYLKENPNEHDERKVHDAMDRCFGSRDYLEGYRAFLEKRKPQFNGE
ncbi:MAG: enoyl-CoA hydratase/isomerase family protein [SAR324 cluster bacterium]|nr:enoyl-CoA hydratase/isomerase family protein [SAR324 cluster bacterium]